VIGSSGGSIDKGTLFGAEYTGGGGLWERRNYGSFQDDLIKHINPVQLGRTSW